MNKVPMALFIICAIIICTITLTWADFNPRDYCGVPPFPEEAPAIPALGAEAKALQPKLVDFYIFTRHGDRSTLTKNCFAKTQFKDRRWVECPANTIAFHSGLQQRNPYAPIYAIPVHPLQDKQILLGNCHLGQLTQRGLLMSYNNGLRIGKYLKDQFDSAQQQAQWTPKVLKLRSTDVHRTRETAEGFITGLLDNMNGDGASLSAQLPPLFFVDEKVDSQKLNTNVCNTGPYIEDVYKKQEWLDYKENTWNPLLAKVRTALNQPDADMNDVFDCIKPFQCHSQPYPEGLKPLQDDIEQVVTQYWAYGYGYDRKLSSQLFTGYMLMELSTLFTQSAMKDITSTPTVQLWSGHDFGSISNLASAFTFPNFLWPPYSAMINVEFYKTANTTETVQQTSFVRFLYLGEVIIPDFCTEYIVAGELCPTEKVLEHVNDYLPTADQCPGIPRNSFDYAPIKAAHQKQLLRNDPTMKPILTAVDNLYNKLNQFDAELEIVQQQKEKSKEFKEKSHIERWNDYA